MFAVPQTPASPQLFFISVAFGSQSVAFFKPEQLAWHVAFDGSKLASRQHTSLPTQSAALAQ